MDSHDSAAEVGRLLDAVPGMTSPKRIQKLAQELERSSRVRIPAPESAKDISRVLADSTVGFAPLLQLVLDRDDWFPDCPQTRELKARLQAICGTTDGVRHLTRGLVLAVTDAIGRQSIDLDVVRQAFLTTVRYIVEPPACNSLAWTHESGFDGCVRQLLDSDPVRGIEWVLAFLDQIDRRLKVRSESPDARIGERCKDLVDGTAHQERLAHVRREGDRIETDDERRPHLLVWISRAMDVDRDTPVNAQHYEVTLWRYWDNAAGYAPPVPLDRFATRLTTSDAVPATGLADLIREWCPAPPDARRQVVELMVDDLCLPDNLIEELGRKHRLVLRPSRAASAPGRWFTNWLRLLGGPGMPFQLVQYRQGLGAVDGGKPLIIMDAPDPAPEMFPALLAANAPVAVWGRRGGRVNGARFTTRVCFRTPDEFFNDRYEGRMPADMVLMWHNPHWFPDDGGLEWRQMETS